MFEALTGPELPTVLIVDDERLNRSMLAELLSPHYRVLLAKDGPGALVIAQREAHRLQLILLDLAMPGMNGYEVLGALRAQERTAHIAVIFITGQSNAQAEEYGLRLGAADYVSKPIRPAVVEVRVRNQIRLALQRQALERLAMVDGLTGLANRRHFDDMLERSHRRSLRTGESVGLALIDIDHFKQYNDCYGHVQGDEALKAVAATLQRHARRPYDLAARFGGEEFVLLLMRTTPEEAERVAERIRAQLSADGYVLAAGQRITISFGIAPVAANTALTDALTRADALLYSAKQAGRDRVHVAADPGRKLPQTA